MDLPDNVTVIPYAFGIATMLTLAAVYFKITQWPLKILSPLGAFIAAPMWVGIHYLWVYFEGGGAPLLVLVFCFAIQEMKRERLFKKYDEKDHTYSYFRLQMESVNADTAGILFLVMFLAWQTDSIRLAI